MLSPDWFFHRDVRCLFEVGISMVMYAQVGLLVHALSILNFDGLYDRVSYYITNCIGGAMVSVLVSSAVDRGFRAPVV